MRVSKDPPGTDLPLCGALKPEAAGQTDTVLQADTYRPRAGVWGRVKGRTAQKYQVYALGHWGRPHRLVSGRRRPRGPQARVKATTDSPSGG